ncbi:Matrix metalloproteinase-16 [Nymphon striatum]|nr:Matrix metalloproteinase-16 [Nymphon striatum]
MFGCNVNSLHGIADGETGLFVDACFRVKKWTSGLDQHEARAQFKKALEIWSKHSKLTFREMNRMDRMDADIVISFYQGNHNDGHPFDGRGNILAHAFFPGKGREGDAHFDSNEVWVPHEPKPDTDEVSLFAVAAHEFGHSLGLSHSSVPGALMFPYYNGFKETDELPRDDIVGIQQLYGAKHPNIWVPLDPVITRPPHPKPKKPYYPRTRPPTVPKKPSSRKPTKRPYFDNKHAPDTCRTTIDAISSVRNEIFVFKDRHFWRINSQNKLATSYPIPIRQFWRGFPHELTSIDAMYERPGDHKLVFFSGDKYWLFRNVKAEPGYPKPLTNLGLPKNIKKIDAAMVWGQNGKTYFFSGKRYWRYSEEDGRVEYDYPRPIRVWGDVPPNIDAAFQWSDGRTYFFKDHFFWLFNDKKMAVDKIGPKLITEFWFNCEKNNSIPIPKPGSHDSKNNIYDQLYGTGYNSADKFVPKLTLILTYFLFIFVRIHV